MCNGFNASLYNFLIDLHQWGHLHYSLGWACSRLGLGWACSRLGLGWACSRLDLGWACSRLGLGWACSRLGLDWACSRLGLDLVQAAAFLHPPSGPDLNQKFHTIIIANTSTVCNAARLKLSAPDCRWCTHDADDAELHSVLVLSWAKHGLLPSWDGQV